MAISSFTRSMGEQQGRLATKDPPDGSYVFVLGSLLEWKFEPLATDDHVDLVQDADVTNVAAIRCKCRLKCPPLSLTGGRRWAAQMIVNGTATGARMLGRPGQSRTFDMLLSTAPYSGVIQVGMRLQLVPA